MSIHVTVLAAVAAFLMPLQAAAQIKSYRAEVVREYPHDVTSYTQGLFFYEGQMYESTGVAGESTFRKVDLETGKALRRLDFSDKYFVEGSVAFGSDLLQVHMDLSA